MSVASLTAVYRLEHLLSNLLPPGKPIVWSVDYETSQGEEKEFINRLDGTYGGLRGRSWPSRPMREIGTAIEALMDAPITVEFSPPLGRFLAERWLDRTEVDNCAVIGVDTETCGEIYGTSVSLIVRPYEPTLLQAMRQPNEMIVIPTAPLPQNIIEYDGKRYTIEDRPALLLFNALRDWKGQWVTGSVLNSLPGLRGKRLPDVLLKIPQPLRDLIESKTGPGGGYCYRGNDCC